MKNLKLGYPVTTLDNELLLQAGSDLSDETINGLISSNKIKSYKSLPLLEYGTVKKDLLRFLSQPPYHVIFSDKKQVSNILKLMENVNLVYPVLETLDYFNEREFYTYRHILMVFALSTLLASDLVHDYKELVREAATGPTHDIGKICIPLNILTKSVPLTKAEMDILMHHSAAGYVLLSYYLRDPEGLTAKVARDHHERKNGVGYPRGIELSDRMIEIVSVSDIYDALISARPYRPTAYDNRTACEEITTMAEKNEVSWDIVKALVAHNRKNKPHYSECDISIEKRGEPPPGNVHGVLADEEEPANE